jgi:hypothetical protein
MKLLLGARHLASSEILAADDREASMTLKTRMSRRDEAAFVGRRRELDLFENLFVDDPPASVVFMHGPGGIGKSTLLREVERRGARAGWTPRVIEGRDLPPVPDALEDALSGANEEERPLLLFDTYERMAALGGYLRRAMLPELPERAIVVIAGRRPPEAGWFEGGWESLAVELELEPLSSDEARELLRAHGLDDKRRAGEVVDWAEGSPLALTLAADAAGADAAWSPSEEEHPPELVKALIRRLVEAELDAVHRDVLGLASVARVVTVELIRDVLPDVDPLDAMEWLRSRTFVEPLGDGFALHDLVSRAARADLRQREPERERELRRRIADSLYDRAVAGNLLLTVDLADLVDSKAIRSFYSWEGAVRNRIDSVREGDAEQVAMVLAATGEADWWERAKRFFDEAPERVAIARDASDALCGFSICVTPANAPPLAQEDLVLGKWLAHAREHVPDGNAILWRDAHDFTDDSESGIQAMLDMDGVLRSGLSNPRYAYLPIDSDHAEAGTFAAALGARHIQELDAKLGDKTVECHLVDYGPSGLLGMQRAVVYMELGITPPGAGDGEEPPEQSAIDAESVREALRNLRVPHELSRSPLARGDGVEARARSVRDLMAEAAQSAFGETDNERLLQRVLVRGYIDPAPSHEAAADELNLSRAAYFRRLKLASERVAEYVSSRN